MVDLLKWCVAQLTSRLHLVLWDEPLVAYGMALLLSRWASAWDRDDQVSWRVSKVTPHEALSREADPDARDQTFGVSRI